MAKKLDVVGNVFVPFNILYILFVGVCLARIYVPIEDIIAVKTVGSIGDTGNICTKIFQILKKSIIRMFKLSLKG